MHTKRFLHKQTHTIDTRQRHRRRQKTAENHVTSQRFRAAATTVAAILGLTLSGCVSKNPLNPVFYTYGMQEISKTNADPVVMQGLHDGCRTAYFTRGNAIYGSIERVIMDPYLLGGSSAYYIAWLRGYIYCFQNASANTHATLGERIVSPAGNRWFSKPDFYIGSGDYAPKIPFTEDINKGVPGFDNLGDPNGSKTFGLFGNCAFC